MSDTDFPFDPDDPRVTAYALDEMHDAGARAGFEQLLARSPEARAMVEEIRALSGQLIAEYDEERLLAQTMPSNVITLPGRRQVAWAGQILRMAAALAVLGIAGALLAPYMRGPQAVKLHPEGEMTPALEAHIPPAADGRREPAVVARSGVASQIALPFGAANAPVPSFAFSVNGKLDQSAAGHVVQQENAPVAKPVDATDAKDERALQAGSRGGQDTAVASASLAQVPAAPATATGNALGGGAGGGVVNLGDMPVNAKDAVFQNRYLNGAFGGDVTSLKRLAPASRTRSLGTLASADESGFVSPAKAPLSSFEIALNTNLQARKQAMASDAREMEREPVAGKTLSDFPFSEAPPAPSEPQALAIQVESARCPWAPGNRLVRIGFKGRPGASDVQQVQVKFDPAQVAAYRLVAGAPAAIQLNAWQEATVLYEVVPAKSPQLRDKAKAMDRLPVDRPETQTATDSELLTIAVQPAAVKAAVFTDALREGFTPVEVHASAGDISGASADFKFAAAVAAYDLDHLDLAIQLAQEGLGDDPGGYRAAFLKTLRNAKAGR